MTHAYQITGMTCSSCESKVRTTLLALPEVTSAEVSQAKGEATITMTKHIGIAYLQKALGGAGSRYTISAAHHNEAAEQAKGWLATYRPILLIFAYVTVIATISSVHNGMFHGMQFMRVFMAGFFLTFSFFKMLDLKGFAESYVMYDVMARRIPAWAYLYAFIELGLGVAYAMNLHPLATNAVTLIVMSISIVGVLQSVLNKKKIQCACLGAVFNLPMSTVTIIEDALMMVMSAAMIYSIL